METLIMEQSTNTHQLESKKGIQNVKKFDNGDIYFESEDGVVTHGEHGTMKVSSFTKVMKSNQMEHDVVSGKMIKAYD